MNQLCEVNGGCCGAVKVRHCELNLFELYWYRAKSLTKENCGFGFEALETIAPEELASVSRASIHAPYIPALRATDSHSTSFQYAINPRSRLVF